MSIHPMSTAVLYFKPILLNIPSISESIDVETKKYKISSVTLNISDYEEDGERFSDSLVDGGGNSIINAQVYIYYASQSAEHFATDDFVQVGHFIVRDFKQTESQVNLICEDRSQAELHKDLPLESVPDTAEIIEKYRTKPIPMVYGSVERSPCVVINDGDSQFISADYRSVDGFNEIAVTVGGNTSYNQGALYIFLNDGYINIAPRVTGEALNNSGNSNYEYDPEDGNIMLLFDEDNDTAKDHLRIINIRKPNGFGTSTSASGDHGANLEITNQSQVQNLAGFAKFEGTVNVKLYNGITTGGFDSVDDTWYGRSIVVFLEDVGSIMLSDLARDEDNNPIQGKTLVYFKMQHEQTAFDDPDNYNAQNGYESTTSSSADRNKTRWGIMVGSSSSNIEPNYMGYDDTLDGSGLGFTSDATLWNSIEGNDLPVELPSWDLQDNFKYIRFGFYKTTTHPGSEQQEDIYPIGDTRLYHLFVVHSDVVGKINSKQSSLLTPPVTCFTHRQCMSPSAPMLKIVQITRLQQQMPPSPLVWTLHLRLFIRLMGMQMMKVVIHIMGNLEITRIMKHSQQKQPTGTVMQIKHLVLTVMTTLP